MKLNAVDNYATKQLVGNIRNSKNNCIIEKRYRNQLSLKNKKAELDNMLFEEEFKEILLQEKQLMIGIESFLEKTNLAEPLINKRFIGIPMSQIQKALEIIDFKKFAGIILIKTK